MSRVLAADWSGAQRNEAKYLWLAEWDPGRAAVVSVEPMSRLEATRRIIDVAHSDSGLVAGLDFCFSMPAWWLQANGIGEARQLWSDTPRLEAWIRDCRPPFWGRRGHPRPDIGGRNPLRVTETATAAFAAHRGTNKSQPRSVFQIGGAGSVGTASLRGMTSLECFKQAGMCVWPFDDWSTPAVVEVWPRLAIGSTVKASRAERALWLEGRADSITARTRQSATESADAFDAVAAALSMAAMTSSPPPNAGRDEIRLEGWIYGVPMPATWS